MDDILSHRFQSILTNAASHRGDKKNWDEWNVPKASSSYVLSVLTSAPPAPANTGVQRT